MPDSKNLAAYLVSAAALLGPLAYILFAFHEQGRLSYFGAPFDFLQISSFGILPVTTTIYPWILVTFMVFSLVSMVRFSAPGHQVVLIAAAFAYVTAVLFYVSLTLLWQSIFACLTALGLGVAIFKNPHFPGLGNEISKPPLEPQHISIKHFAQVKRYVLALGGVAIFVFIFTALGKKEAATQEFYWKTQDGVVLGFYGEQVLIGELRGYEVGPEFRFVELKSIQGSMKLLRMGPLKAAPMWKTPGPGF